MIAVVTVTDAATQIIAPGDRGGDETLSICNTSDTAWYIAVGEANGASLTTANGMPLAAGGERIFSGNVSRKAFFAIHASAGQEKTGRAQSF